MCPKPAIELMAAQHGTDRQPSQHAGPDEGQPGSDVGREHARVITRDPAISNRSRLRGQADTVPLVGEVDAHRPCIEVLDGRCRGRVFELVRRQTVVGRSPGADLRIDDAGVSRRHIKLNVLDDGSVVAHDMRSTNGMIVNGERCDKVTLREGDLDDLIYRRVELTGTYVPDHQFTIVGVAQDGSNGTDAVNALQLVITGAPGTTGSFTPGTDLAEGPHTLEVRAIAEGTYADPTPASSTITVSRTNSAAARPRSKPGSMRWSAPAARSCCCSMNVRSWRCSPLPTRCATKAATPSPRCTGSASAR